MRKSVREAYKKVDQQCERIHEYVLAGLQISQNTRRERCTDTNKLKGRKRKRDTKNTYTQEVKVSKQNKKQMRDIGVCFKILKNSNSNMDYYSQNNLRSS